MTTVTWSQELANELKTVLKGAEHEARPDTIQNLVDYLESGEAEEAQVITRLRTARLGWFAERLENNVFHNREANGNLHD